MMQGVVCCMTPRDMAKYGYLILNRGVWEGKQIIPADFVVESVKTHTTFNANSGYGYESWWTIPLDGYYYAAGIRGQKSTSWKNRTWWS